MAVFTLFAYGTGEKSTPTKDEPDGTKGLITQFIKACESTPPDKHTFIEGPDLLGLKVKDNVKKGTRQIVDWLLEQDGEENNINLSGFSRGAVTCIQIANTLKRYQSFLEMNQDHLSDEGIKLLTRLKALKIHMFLMDPVAGITDKSPKHARVIPDNVESAVMILQKDERRVDFKPQDLTRIIVASPQKTKISMLPMFGNHSDNTKIKSDTMASGPKLVWYAMHQFLTQHGTKFKDNKVPKIAYGKSYVNAQGKTVARDPEELPVSPTAKDLLKLSTESHNARKAYYESGIVAKLLDSIPVPRVPRTMNKHARFYVKDHTFFANQLERELFKVAYPKSFNYLFEQNIKDHRFPNDSHSSEEDVIKELADLKIEDPELFAHLKNRGVKVVDDKITLNRPRGIKSLEPCATLLQIYPDMKELPPSVKEHAADMNKLSLLEMEVYRRTFQYEREKLEINFARNRSQSDLTALIRDEIYHIVNSSPLNEDGTENRSKKYEDILQTLEHHYKTLILSNSHSDLSNTLKQILSNHGRLYKITPPSLANDLLVSFVHEFLTFAKETISFVGHLGYVGGGAFYAVGLFLENLGVRSIELIGDVGYNPLKGLAVFAATMVGIIGVVVKNSFGLKPLTEFITKGVKEFRDWLVIAMNQTTIEQINPINPEPVERLDSALEKPVSSEELPATHEESQQTYKERLEKIKHQAVDEKEVSANNSNDGISVIPTV